MSRGKYKVEYLDFEHYREINESTLFYIEDIINIETLPDPDKCASGASYLHNITSTPQYRVWYRREV